MTKGTRSAKPVNQTKPETDHTEGSGETPPTPAADSSSMGEMGQEQSSGSGETPPTPVADSSSMGDMGQEQFPAFPSFAEAPFAERSSENPDRMPLSGIRVIDVGNFLAGPYAASILGEIGRAHV